MALTLKTAISADQTTIDVEGTDTLREGSFRTLGDETVLIRTARVQNLQPGETAWQRLSVDRGIENTEAVAHDAGVTLGTYSGGGAVEVNSTPVTNIVAPGAVIDGETATLAVLLSETEPVGTFADGTMWVQPDPGNDVNNWQLRVMYLEEWRLVGAADDFGQESTTGLLVYVDGSRRADLVMSANQVVLGHYDADFHQIGRFRSSAAEGIQIEKYAFGTDNIAAAITITEDGSALVGGVGFYGTAPIAKPTGVAVTAEAIHAALVSLGLISA